MKVALLVASAIMLLASAGHAAITNNGNGTFTDGATGLVWQDVDTFYGDDFQADQSLLLTGFTFASKAQVDQLETDTGLTASTPDATYISVAAAMGVPTPTPVGRENIWGLYGSGANYAFIYGPADMFSTGWTDLPAFTSSYSDLGAFAVSSAPEPQGWALILVGVGAMGMGLRSRRIRVPAI